MSINIVLTFSRMFCLFVYIEYIGLYYAFLVDMYKCGFGLGADMCLDMLWWLSVYVAQRLSHRALFMERSFVYSLQDWCLLPACYRNTAIY